MSALAAMAVLASSGVQAYEIWVTNQRSNKIQVIDGESLNVTDEIETGVKPHNITMNHSGTRAYVANLRSGDFAVIDTSSHNVLKTVQAGKTTHHVGVSPDDERLFVTVRGENIVAVYDAKSLERLETIPVGNGPAMVMFSPDGKRAYGTNGRDRSVSIIDVMSMKVIGTITGVGGWTTASVMSPDGKLIVTGSAGDKYSIIDTATDRVVVEEVAGKDPHGVVLEPDGKHALVTNLLSNDVSRIDIASGKITDTIADVGDKPSNIAVSPDGKRAFVTLVGERSAGDPEGRLSGKNAGVSVINLASKKVVVLIPLGGDPYDIAIRY
jgi:YVTN family beta-propeller protein